MSAPNVVDIPDSTPASELEGTYGLHVASAHASYQKILAAAAAAKAHRDGLIASTADGANLADRMYAEYAMRTQIRR
jgi:hypothetical protein